MTTIAVAGPGWSQEPHVSTGTQILGPSFIVSQGALAGSCITVEQPALACWCYRCWLCFLCPIEEKHRCMLWQICSQQVFLTSLQKIWTFDLNIFCMKCWWKNTHLWLRKLPLYSIIFSHVSWNRDMWNEIKVWITI